MLFSGFSLMSTTSHRVINKFVLLRWYSVFADLYLQADEMIAANFSKLLTVSV